MNLKSQKKIIYRRIKLKFKANKTTSFIVGMTFAEVISSMIREEKQMVIIRNQLIRSNI